MAVAAVEARPGRLERVEGAVALREIEAARARIAARTATTPLRLSASLSRKTGRPVHLKLETQQTTGSFKLRGTVNAVLCLPEQDRAKGLVTASTGNHGRAVAYAAREVGVRAVVCMSALVPSNKVEAIRTLGAEVRIIGCSQDEAQIEVDRLIREQRLTQIPPFDHPDVIAGQGTIGLEIAEALPDVESVLVPLSGGGLAAGVAAAIKAMRPKTRVIGVSMARGAAMHASLAAGRPVEVGEVETLADSLGGGVGLSNRYTFRMCRELLDHVALLDEEEIAAGIRHAFEVEGETVEGAGAVAIAALLFDKVRLRGPSVALLSGRNIDASLHRDIVAGRWPRKAVA
jgi:threonine dehydratase